MKQDSKHEDNRNEMVDKVTEDLRNFYEKIIKNKDEKINELNKEIDDLKSMIISRTEQANENMKKMAKINISMKNDLEHFKKINNDLKNDLISTKNQYVKLNDVDECYKTLRKEKQNLQVENDELRNKIKELSNLKNNNLLSNYRSNDNHSNTNNIYKHNQTNLETPSSVRFKSPNVNKKQMNFNSDCNISYEKKNNFHNHSFDNNDVYQTSYDQECIDHQVTKDTMDNINTTVGTVSSNYNHSVIGSKNDRT